MTPLIEVGMKLKIAIFLFRSARNSLGSLMNHVTSLSVRSTVVYAEIIYFHQRTACGAPVCWSKYTTSCFQKDKKKFERTEDLIMDFPLFDGDVERM